MGDWTIIVRLVSPLFARACVSFVRFARISRICWIIEILCRIVYRWIDWWLLLQLLTAISSHVRSPFFCVLILDLSFSLSDSWMRTASSYELWVSTIFAFGKRFVPCWSIDLLCSVHCVFISVFSSLAHVHSSLWTVQASLFHLNWQSEWMETCGLMQQHRIELLSLHRWTFFIFWRLSFLCLAVLLVCCSQS